MTGAQPGRIGFVPARYGPTVIGGAEIVLGQMAAGFAARGWDVEILTTCALDLFSFANELPAGVCVEDGMTVRRFPAVADTPGEERAQVEAVVLGGGSVPLSAQERWMNDGVRVPELYHYLLDHGRDYRALVFGPYLFWPAFACSQVVPARSVLWTCFHDEPQARFELFQPMLSGVAGLLLQTEPEHDLAHRLVPRLAPHAVVGCGVEVPASYQPERFRERYGIDRPFLFYAGRREGAKGWEGLLSAFAGAVRDDGCPFALVTAGAGPVAPPPGIEDRVIDVGFLPAEDRDDAFAAATAYVQPSRYEAFSRTVMEAWLAGTPVVANAASDVVEWHCRRSGAGIVYGDEWEFSQALRFLAERPKAAAEMAAAGRAYVLDNYQWDDVLDRVETSIVSWTTA